MKSDEIISNYMIRHTQKQKHEFLDYAKLEFEKYGYTTYIQKVRTFGIPNYNLIIGDVENAEVIFTAHYDTPNIIIGGITMYPSSFIKSLLSQLKIIAVALIIWIVAAQYLGALGYYAFLVIVILGCMTFTNRNNYNDNTSGVLTIYNLVSQLKEQDKVAFVLFDNEEKGLLGSKGFAKKYKRVASDTLFINFDCVGIGDNILLGANKRTIDIANELNKLSTTNKKVIKSYMKKNPLLMSDDNSFRNSIQVMAFKGVNRKLWLDNIHTNKDTELDEENIDVITHLMIEYCRRKNNN